MSRHITYFPLRTNTYIAYGFDSPTGGFFFQELNDEDDEIDGKDGLTLSELFLYFKENGIDVDEKQLVKDFENAELPTNLQLNVGKMFGKNITDMLLNVYFDITENWAEYLKD
jgi:hypothetical protein